PAGVAGFREGCASRERRRECTPRRPGVSHARACAFGATFVRRGVEAFGGLTSFGAMGTESRRTPTADAQPTTETGGADGRSARTLGGSRERRTDPATASNRHHLLPL